MPKQGLICERKTVFFNAAVLSLKTYKGEVIRHMLRKIILNGREVSCELERKKVKNVNLRVRADGSIYVSASRRVSEEFIMSFILSKADFILRAIDRYERLAESVPKSDYYQDGDKISFLGRAVRLKVICGSKNRVRHICNGEEFLLVEVKDVENAELRKRTVEKWLREICVETVNKECRKIYPLFEPFGIAYPEIKFRHMVSRWGSCQPKRGILTFNTALIETPIECVEYVAAHEFTHFLHPDHSARFYASLAQIVPDWKERRKKMERYGVKGRR